MQLMTQTSIELVELKIFYNFYIVLVIKCGLKIIS